LFEDHYITEHWNAAESRWQLTDPQIDDVQRPAIAEGLNTNDLPENVFLTGWQLIEGLRSGNVPTSIGFPPVNTGFTYARNKLFADFVAMTGHELPVHAWWGIGDPKSVRPGDDALIELMIRLLKGIDANDPAALEEALQLAATHERLKMPKGYVVKTYKAPFC
jgi:hypothetical protein